MKYLSIATSIAALVISGCRSGAIYETSVSSYAEPSARKYSKFTIKPGLKTIDTEDLEYKEYSRLISRALEADGFIPSNDQSAEVIIFASYSIGEPRTELYTYDVPTWGSAITSSTTTGHASTSFYGNRGTTSYHATTQYNRTPVVTGTTSKIETVTLYDRVLSLEAVLKDQLKNDGKIIQAWKVRISSTGQSGDLRNVIPPMLVAAKQYFGKDSTKVVHIKVKERDKRIEILTSTSELNVTPGNNISQKKVIKKPISPKAG